MGQQGKTRWILVVVAVGVVGAATAVGLGERGNQFTNALFGGGASVLGALGLARGVRAVPWPRKSGGAIDVVKVAGPVLFVGGGGLTALVGGEALGNGTGTVLALGVIAFLTGLLLMRGNG